MSDTLEFIHPQLRSLAIPIEELNEDPANANAHNDASLEGIAASFVKFGQRKPIVVRKEGMVVEAGNGTLAALRKAGWTHLACVECDDDEEMATAYALADNRTAQLATWNYTQLATNVQELLDAGFDCTVLGWSDAALQDVIGEEWTAQNDFGEQGEDDGDKPPAPGDGDAADDTTPAEEPPIPELPAEPVTKLGEVIQLGPHTLHCADCMDVMAGLADNSVDAIVTDPMYGLSPDGKARTWDDIAVLREAGKHAPKSGFLGKEWDAGVPGVTWARECLRVLKPGGHIVAFSHVRTIHRLACAVEDAGFEIRDQYEWVYWQGMPHSLDLARAIDHARPEDPRTRIVCRWLRSEMTSRGVTAAAIAEHFGFHSRMVDHWAARDTDSQPTTPRLDQIPTLFGALEITDPPQEITDALLALNDAKGTPGDAWGDRSVVASKVMPDTSAGVALGFAGSAHSGDASGRTRVVDITTAASEDAKHWEGWGSHLKPSVEPAVFARKPLETGFTLAKNVLKWGTGAINIEACKHRDGDQAWPGPWSSSDPKWPANLYYCPKPSTSEKRAGCDDVDRQHETVKPVRLMAQLLRLVTPSGGVVLEPFGGSGTTAVASAGLNCSVVIAEMAPGYCDIIRARVNHSLLPPERRKPPRDGDKTQARRRVQTLIDNGAIKAPNDEPCFDCGDETCESPHEYDHYLGYGSEHHEAVQAVCSKCHHDREAERVRLGIAP